MVRFPAVELITPKVAAWLMFVPGGPKFGVFVTPVASIRIWSFKRSRIGNALNSAAFNDRVPGARK